jgi:hypothetical protein
MKLIINILFTTFAIALTASASPNMIAEITLSERVANGDKTLARPTLAIKSGAQVIGQSGTIKYAITPTLLDDGTAKVSTVITKIDGENGHEFPALETKAKLGQVAKVRSDRFALETKTTLAK